MSKTALFLKKQIPTTEKREGSRELHSGATIRRSSIPRAPAMSGLTLDGKPHPQMYIMSRQAHFIEVEVDTETGEVIVTNLVCVNDVGHLFNRRGAEAQQYGGAIMGLGRSATEEKVYCPQHRRRIEFRQHRLPYRDDERLSGDRLHHQRKPSGVFVLRRLRHRRRHGASLSGITAGAIYNATGKWALDYPLTPDKVLKALGKI